MAFFDKGWLYLVLCVFLCSYSLRSRRITATMVLPIIPFCLAALFHATSGCAHSLPALEARGKGFKASGASGSDSLELDDYSAEGEAVDEDGIQMSRTNIIIISVVSGISFILIIGSIFLCVWVRRRRKRKAARTSFSEDTQHVPNGSPAGEHHQEYKTDEQQPLYSEQPSGLNIHHAHHAQHASYVSHASHVSHDSTHDQHLSLLSAYNNSPPPPYSNSYGNSPPGQYSPLHNQGVGGFEPSYPAPTATPNGLHYSTPLSRGEANAYYGR